MKKRERVVVQLCTKDDQQYAFIKDSGKRTNTTTLIKFLDECRKNREITSGKKIRRENTTDYVYDIKLTEDSGINKYSFIVKVKNSEKSLYYETIKYMESLCDLSATIKKVNVARLAAGLFASAFIVVSAGPSIIKLHKENNEKRIQYEQQLYEERQRQKYSEPYIPTEEEKREAEERYYESLEEKELEESETKGKSM